LANPVNLQSLFYWFFFGSQNLSNFIFEKQKPRKPHRHDTVHNKILIGETGFLLNEGESEYKIYKFFWEIKPGKPNSNLELKSNKIFKSGKSVNENEVIFKLISHYDYINLKFIRELNQLKSQ
jgi:hypothetical protein